MGTSINYRDLFIRIFVIAITSFVLVLSTKSNEFDIHFRIRKTQPTSEKIQIIEVQRLLDFNQIISHLEKKNVKQIFVDSLIYTSKRDGVTPYSLSSSDPDSLNLEIKPDLDGITRRFHLNNNPTNDLEPLQSKKSLTINFRGNKGTFESLAPYSLTDSDTQLKDKYILLVSSANLVNYTTPVGLISETEIVANILDNFIEHRFIPDGKTWVQILILLISLFIVTTLILYLPSTLALLATFLISIFYISISLWFFDNYYFWTPILNPVIQNVLTFLLLSNYKFVLNEKTKWNLEKESSYFNEVEEMKTNFLSLFSHDLKTPLAKIIGITDTLIAKTNDKNTLAELEKINHSSRDLEKYIKRILKMSQVQSKNISINKTPVDLNTLIEKSIQQNKLLANEKSITIKKKLNPLFMIDIDGSLVQEVVVNFLENAIKYSPPGSTIEINSEEYNNYIKVSVTDQGPGIPKEVQESIWEKYYRFDSKESGYGLGLFLSRYVINLHGGQVFLNSKQNNGSEFGFIIPIDEEGI